ncbi:MAG: hypothetical protein HXY41_01920 [Chloroflexi bacterium]|nr:hypothetical protein [Chloroflexota bacterium]
MSQPWNSLFCRCDDAVAVAQTLRETLVAAGYTPYDPFGMIPGPAYREHRRLFVAPAAGGWVRVIGAPDAALLPPLSRLGLCLLLALNGDEAAVSVYADGAPADLEPALAPYLRPGCAADDLRRVLLGDAPGAARQPTPETLPLDALPPDVAALVGRVNPAQAQKLFDRLGGQLLGKTGGADEAEAARALIVGQGQPDWNSPGGARLRALADCLALPADWRQPDFITLRDAYQLHRRRRQNPNARLYPGDADAMARVPDALDYQPVYGGRS